MIWSGTNDRVFAVLGACLVLIAALVFRLGFMQAPGEFDEYYHLIAARGLVETGTPQILDGEYWRGMLFTRLVAGTFLLSGSQDLETARMVSLGAGVLLPVTLFAFVCRVVGLGTALVCAGLSVLWPQGILEAQFARFYALHSLAFLAGAAAFYIALAGPSRYRLTFFMAALACLALALHFQVSTAIGLAGIVLGGLAVLVVRRAIRPRALAMLAAASVSLTILAVLWPGADALWSRAWDFYRWTPLHAEALRDYYGFYHNQFQKQYGLLWYAMPVLTLLAVRAHAALALYSLAIFTVCFLAHSFGGMKALRYMSYATLFLFILWALGLRAAIGLLPESLHPRARTGLAVLVALILLATTSFLPRSLQFAGSSGLAPRGDWSNAATVVGSWIDAPFVATTRELHQIAYLGSYDVLFSPSRLTEITPERDFARDPRTGRPVIGSVENMRRAFLCVPDGLLVTSPHWWDTAGWGARLLPTAEAAGIVVAQRKEGAVLAVRWHATRESPAVCADIDSALGPEPPS